MPASSRVKQVNIRIDSGLFQALTSIARHDRRSVPQVAKLLLEEGLKRRALGPASLEDVTAVEIAALAMAGGSYDWLAEEPELYDDTCGEAI